VILRQTRLLALWTVKSSAVERSGSTKPRNVPEKIGGIGVAISGVGTGVATEGVVVPGVIVRPETGMMTKANCNQS
jgi:hypothetical protein